MNIEKIRSEFPHLETEQLYFDHAAVSPLNNRSRKNIEHYIKEAQSENINNFEDTLELNNVIRNGFAKLIRTSVDRISTVKSTTDGFILLARGLLWETGDNIVIHRKEFPSNVYPWYDLKYKGVEVKFIDSELGKVTPQELEKVIDENTKLVSVSWVQYSSGYRNNITELAEWCHSRNILLAVDVMQGLGALAFDVEKTGADFLSTGTAKWLLGPQGIGFIYVTKELQKKLNPPHLGWHSRLDMLDFHNYDQPLKPDASRFEFATPYSIGIWSFAGAIEIILESDSNEIERHIIKNSDRLVEGVKNIGFNVISDRSNQNVKSGIVVISNENEKLNEIIHSKLIDRKVTISLRNNRLRISPHFYNTTNEIDQFLNVLEAVKKDI